MLKTAMTADPMTIGFTYAGPGCDIGCNPAHAKLATVVKAMEGGRSNFACKTATIDMITAQGGTAGWATMTESGLEALNA